MDEVRGESDGLVVTFDGFVSALDADERSIAGVILNPHAEVVHVVGPVSPRCTMQHHATFHSTFFEALAAEQAPFERVMVDTAPLTRCPS
ncbi:hypothetical protein R4227_18650 [Gordonia amicalis]|uniref:hypothetical protein n=1 Tax=Gordonia amicalis TaxID=89053 RepID=UPI002953F9E3|nr:hypothetical protein [Gordonia amicalis]MDV7102082.1 hypothetical protein [Gordonia amicalis]